MFCPLCQAEYRVGFAKCSECKVPLVGTLDEASGKNVSVWKGESERKLDAVLDVLAGAGIPYHFRETLSSVPKLEFSYVPIRPSLELQVWVLRENLTRAEAMIRDLDRDVGEDEEDAAGSDRQWCPLCKAEYRKGFAECSDCHAQLVGTKTQAQHSKVVSLWRGKSKRGLEDILSALQAADIPLRFKEHVKIQPAFQFVIFGINLLPRRSTFESEFEVLVLSVDESRARLAMQQVGIVNRDRKQA